MNLKAGAALPTVGIALRILAVSPLGLWNDPASKLQGECFQYAYADYYCRADNRLVTETICSCPSGKYSGFCVAGDCGDKNSEGNPSACDGYAYSYCVYS